MTGRLLFFTTSGCHLCEQAQAMLPGVLAHANQLRDRTGLVQLQMQPVEIGEDVVLVQRYGSRIPVLQLEETGQELGWPFDQARLFAYLTGMER